MMDNDVGSSAKVATLFTKTTHHRQQQQQQRQQQQQQKSLDDYFSRELERQWHHLLCLLRPPLQPLVNNGLTSSSPPNLDSEQNVRPCRPRQLSGPSNERSKRSGNAKAVPASSSSPAASSPAASSPATSTPAASTAAASAERPSSTHPSGSTLRNTKRQLPGEAAGRAVPVHKKSETVDPNPSIEYKLVLVQEPTTGAAFEENLLGRIGLAPPLILELQVNKNGKTSDASAELPFLICQCSLLDEQGGFADMVNQGAVAAAAASQSSSNLTVPTQTKRARRGRRSSSGRRGSASTSAVSTRSSESTDASTPAGAASDDTPSSTTATPTGQDTPTHLARMLYGTLVAGPQQYLPPPPSSNTDAQSAEQPMEEKPFFFFPEISIRTPGKFKIVCKLMRLSFPGMQGGFEKKSEDDGPLAVVETQVFAVVKRNEYTAPYITDVSRHFARQGVPLLLPPGVSAD